MRERVTRATGVQAEKSALASILAPIREEDFFKNFWEKKHVVARCAAARPCGGRAATQKTDALRRAGAANADRFRPLFTKEYLDEARGFALRRRRAMSRHAARADARATTRS
jgi:hypothetical protein